MEISLKELKDLLPSKSTDHSFEVGKCYLIRTVTMHHVGRLKSITDSDLVLADACWVADSGRFHQCLKNGDFSELEPFVDDVGINRAGIIDFTIWKHPLPREQK